MRDIGVLVAKQSLGTHFLVRVLASHWLNPLFLIKALSILNTRSTTFNYAVAWGGEVA